MKKLFKFTRRNEHLRLRKIRSMLRHDLRTPLMTIEIGAASVKDSVEKIVKSYTIAPYSAGLISEMQPEHLQRLFGVLGNIEQEAVTADFYIDLIAYLVCQELKEKKEAELYELIQRAFDRIPEYLKNNRVQLNIDFNHEKIAILVDKDAFEISIILLILNAIRRSFENQQLIIDVSIMTQGRFNILLFKDNGKAVEKELQDDIQFQACKEIIRRHRGRITYTLTNDKHTVYSIRFPKVY